MFGGKKKKDLNYLKLTPIRLHDYKVKDDGLVDVLVPKFNNKFARKYFSKYLKNPHIRANLDDKGAATWLLMDGESRVEEIAEELDEKFGEEIRPVTDRLIKFLNNLYRNGFITFKELKKG